MLTPWAILYTVLTMEQVVLLMPDVPRVLHTQGGGARQEEWDEEGGNAR